MLITLKQQFRAKITKWEVDEELGQKNKGQKNMASACLSY